jgi:hypothetical protein
MKSAAHGGLRAADFRDWPVFEGIRANPSFVAVFEEILKEKLSVGTEGLVEESLRKELPES